MLSKLKRLHMRLSKPRLQGSRGVRSGRRSGLQNLTRLRMNLLVFDFAGLPPTAKSFYEIDGADHLLAEELCLQPFAGYQRGLCGDYIEESRDCADIAVVGDRQRAARIFAGSRLG